MKCKISYACHLYLIWSEIKKQKKALFMGDMNAWWVFFGFFWRFHCRKLLQMSGHSRVTIDFVAQEWQSHSFAAYLSSGAGSCLKFAIWVGNKTNCFSSRPHNMACFISGRRRENALTFLTWSTTIAWVYSCKTLSWGHQLWIQSWDKTAKCKPPWMSYWKNIIKKCT